jgi:2-polyprenyl-3-methyl-5-hydroxy-6-metoxy-1,4-benzoquinol methylase
MSTSMSVVPARSAYDTWHGRLDVDSDADSPWHRLLFAHLDPERDLAGKHVLEIACGRGGLACRLAGGAHRPANLVAADFSSAAVEKGRAHAARVGVAGVKWSVTDLQACALRDGTFHTVISCESVEHLQRPRDACEELARVMRTGGRLFLTTPNYLGPMGMYRGYLRVRGRRYSEEGQPINRFTLLPVTSAWLRGTGLRIVSVDAIGHYLPWPGRPPRVLSWLDGVRPLRWFALHSLVVAEKR